MTPQSGNGSAARDIALLGALSLFLSAIEYLVPKPLPFLRLGLANLPLLLALDIVPFGFYCRLVLIKALGQAVISGSLFSYIALFSLAGSVSSASCMYGLYRALGRRGGLFRISLAGTSLAGAFVSSAVQLVLARFFVFGKSALYLAPPFLTAGIISGAALGMFAEAFAGQSVWLSNRRNRELRAGAFGDSAGEAFPARGENGPGTRIPGPARICAGLAAALLFTLVPRIELQAALFTVFWIAVTAGGRKTNPVITLAVMTGIAACNLFPSYGKILAEYGPVTIALGSLEGGIRKALNLEGLVMLSKLVMPAAGKAEPKRRVKDHARAAPGSFRQLLSETFGILEQLNRQKTGLGKLTGKTLVKRLDALLLRLSGF